MDNYYDFLDNNINDSIKADVGFSCLISSAYYNLEDGEKEKFFNRYEKINRFQKICVDIFNASLNREIDPEIANLVINELPEYCGHRFHKELLAKKKDLPVFFRTDEVEPGKISEIQCPGSAWGLYEQVYQFFDYFRSQTGDSSLFKQGLGKSFSDALKGRLPHEPLIHHLMDNASIPAGIRFFIQATRQYGLKYFGYDKGVTPYNCNFIRSHAFQGLLSDNFFRMRMEKALEGEVFHDLPPSILFDEKIPLIFPFWEKTREYFTEELRDLFPYTQLIQPEGFELEDGNWITIDKFIDLPRKKRNYYIKYAGSDLALNWGSKGVFYAGSLSKSKAKEIFDKISKDFALKKYWIIQKGHLCSTKTGYIDRNNREKETRVNSKYSGFYGPEGLMGVLVMQRPFYKVHGSEDTIVSIV